MEIEDTNTKTQENLNLANSDKQAKEENKDTNANVSKKEETNEIVSENKDNQADKTDLPKGVKKELWQLRKEKKELSQELDKLKTQFSTVKQTNSETRKEFDQLENPEEWEETLLKKAEDRIIQKFQNVEMNKRISEEAKQAEDFLINLPEMDDEKSMDGINDMLNSPFYTELKKVYPLKAAKFAYIEWKEKNGIGRKTPTNDTSIKSATSSLGKKVWTRAEIEKTLSDFKNPKYKEIETEIDNAIKEGRVK